ncbi:hypothetical protein OH809_42275 [Streptomyces sp. NBC_00873]|nr:hypothetical protein OH809_01435 [Streptomyces sp. NBC_00873]WSY96709.1 hypothetical protein OH809_42275 [Streptomyces sp. NBC_00873]WTA41517.1 hypothetical protein OH821_01430 [Streptomyces sp. NBC_00842]WTA48379.1 hypothetical protein OH821_42380 [Streptomyces sp. NBC_00842]
MSFGQAVAEAQSDLMVHQITTAKSEREPAWKPLPVVEPGF